MAETKNAHGGSIVKCGHSQEREVDGHSGKIEDGWL
jgi:hypothetical protein